MRQRLVRLALAAALAGCQPPSVPDTSPAPPTDPQADAPSPSTLPQTPAPTLPPLGSAGPSPAAWGRSTATPPAPTPKPSPQPKRRGRSITGLATYWVAQGAAAGPLLRRLLGPHYVGRHIRVWVDGHGPVLLRVTTSCACGDRPGGHTVVDLPRWALFSLGLGTGPGVYHVVVQEVP